MDATTVMCAGNLIRALRCGVWTFLFCVVQFCGSSLTLQSVCYSGDVAMYFRDGWSSARLPGNFSVKSWSNVGKPPLRKFRGFYKVGIRLID